MTRGVPSLLVVSALFALHASPAWAAPLATGGGFEPPWLRLILGFFFCALVALAGALALKRSMGARGVAPNFFKALLKAPEREVLVRETQRVGANAEISAVRWRERDYLIVVCASGAVTVLESREAGQTP